MLRWFRFRSVTDYTLKHFRTEIFVGTRALVWISVETPLPHTPVEQNVVPVCPAGSASGCDHVPGPQWASPPSTPVNCPVTSATVIYVPVLSEPRGAEFFQMIFLLKAFFFFFGQEINSVSHNVTLFQLFWDFHSFQQAHFGANTDSEWG